MSTGNMPNPPDTPNQPGGAPPAPATEPSADLSPQADEALPLPADMARVLREQADIIAQQLVYHSQLMMGVSALGLDIVNARSIVLTLADALDAGAVGQSEKSLMRVANALVPQVNDRTLPYKLNSQIAGLLEGLVLDTLSKAYGSDPERAKQARAILQPVFQSANERAQTQPSEMAVWQAPAPGPNARS